MSYIIVWRNSHRDPFVDVNSHQFLESYSTYDDAKVVAEELLENENVGEKSQWYFDYQIYEEVNG